MKRSSTTGIRSRLTAAGLFFIALFIVLGLRAFQLQILEGAKLKRLGERQHLKELVIQPKRGTILDRSAEPLALSLEGQSVYVRPQRLKGAEAAGHALAQILGMEVSEVSRRLNSNKPFVWLKRKVTPKEAERVEALNIDGVEIYPEPDRYYPQGQLAGHVIGFVGRDSQALEGVELHYDAVLRGESGSSRVERDALGRRVLVQGVEELRIPPGSDIQLTLDTSIQHLAEKELEAVAVKYRAKGGIAVVVEPFTGEILALANYPFFNPNNFTAQAAQQRRNRAVTDSFEPGSTFKAVLAAAALEEEVVSQDDLFFCENGKYPFAGKVIHDSHAYGWLPFSKIIQHSSNIGATKVAEKLNKQRYFKYIEKFGFGRPTGIDLPGEPPGLVRPVDKWAPIDLATHSFGQGISVTPVQLAMAYAAIANGGILMRPFIVRRAFGPDGQVLWENQPRVVRRVVSEKTARSMTNILKGVVGGGGTGGMAAVDGFEVAGKTGTAQKADQVRGGYAAKKRVASFIGFAPADDPRLVMLVIIDEPEVNVYGGVVAAPAFRAIAGGALRRLGVAPDKLDSQPSPVSRESAAPQLERKSGPVGQKADGASEVPDFVGLSLREAVAKARELKLRVELRGTGYVVEQSPSAGANAAKIGALTLNLQG